MVLKVAGDFSNFPDIMPELDQYNYTFINNTLYISDVNSQRNFRNKIIRIFNNNCYVAEISSKNIKLESVNAQGWCEKQLAWASLIQFEKSQQKALSQTMDLLNDIDAKIDQYIKERGDANGRNRKEEEGKAPEEETGS